MGADTRAKYRKYFAAFSEFCLPHPVPDTIGALQVKVLEMLDCMMLNDCPKNDGDYLVAAVKDALPFAAGIGSLPRVAWDLKGFSKKAPPRSRARCPRR